MAIWISVQAFRRCAGIVSVYLCRGGAKKQITPGVSDIDFILIVGPDATERKRVEIVFRRLQTFSARLIPYHHTFVLDEPELHFLWRTTPLRRYFFEEGKSTWRLLHGRDVTGALPPISEPERMAACFAYMNYWWAQFAEFLLQNETHRRDLILRRSVCVKVVPDVANALHALRTGEFCYSRAEALRREGSLLCRELAAAAAQRLPRRDPALEEKVYRYLVNAFLDLWDTFRVRPFLAVHDGIKQTVEPASEETNTEMAQPSFAALRQQLLAAWGPKCRNLHLLKSAFYPLDCSLLVIDADRANLPTLADLERLISRLESAYAGRRAPYLVLRIGEVGFPLTPFIPRDFHRGVLTPATTPDVFLQLGISPVYWTSYTQWYLGEWDTNRQWLEAPPAKRRQLEAIARSAAAGHVQYPLCPLEVVV